MTIKLKNMLTEFSLESKATKAGTMQKNSTYKHQKTRLSLVRESDSRILKVCSGYSTIITEGV